MRKSIIFVVFILILIAINYSVYEKEQILKNGTPLLLELAPVDPRSLMQGDYMNLSYKLNETPSISKIMQDRKRGYMVVRGDDNNIAQFVRIYNNEELAAGEKLLYFHNYGWRINIVPNAFFFQEGHAEYYQNAKYGIFIFDENGKGLLQGLADADRNEITVKETIK